MTGSDDANPQPRRVLLATDLSASCDRALDRAVSLARSWQAELVAVRAIEKKDDFHADDFTRRLPPWRKTTDASRVVEEHLRRDMRQLVNKIVAVVENGEPAEVILRAAMVHGCDLIVTGIARDETSESFRLGRTVDHLLAGSSVPLLIVKQRVRSAYRDIVLTTDLSTASRHALQTAMTFFSGYKFGIFHAFDAPMPVLLSDPTRHLEDCREIAVRDCERFLTEAGISQQGDFEIFVENGQPAQLIGQHVRDRRADLVVLAPHGRSALLELFIGSTAKDMLSSLPCDALVVREPQSIPKTENRS